MDETRKNFVNLSNLISSATKPIVDVPWGSMMAYSFDEDEPTTIWKGSETGKKVLSITKYLQEEYSTVVSIVENLDKLNGLLTDSESIQEKMEEAKESVDIAQSEKLLEEGTSIDTRKPVQKEIRFISGNPNKPARLKICPYGNLNKHISENYHFILEGASESFKARFELFPTKKVDYINFFGEESLVWSYTGSTLNANVYSNMDDQKINWYSDFSKFVIENLGFPKGGGEDLVVVLEYEDFVRVGYLLAFSVEKQSQSRNLVSFSFSMVIKDFFNYTD